ncbi:MAG: hypothetical protein DK306_000860 [Chloroflexi bacterium]|jgi:hypothetical protein|nr:MAG: hypothetical protein DK306_000860 [Chloroflexota bacterium]
MPLHRIRAASLEGAEALESRLEAEGIRLDEGRTMLNRRTVGAAALIVIRGLLLVGVTDDDAALAPGEGVLLPAETVYSLQAPEDVVAVLFALPESPDA